MTAPAKHSATARLGWLLVACLLESCADREARVGAPCDSLPYQYDAVYGSRCRLELAAVRDSLATERADYMECLMRAREGRTSLPDTAYFDRAWFGERAGEPVYNGEPRQADGDYMFRMTARDMGRGVVIPPPAPVAMAGWCDADSSYRWIRVDRQGRVVVSP